jgi:hypothetical protein
MLLFAFLHQLGPQVPIVLLVHAVELQHLDVLFREHRLAILKGFLDGAPQVTALPLNRFDLRFFFLALDGQERSLPAEFRFVDYDKRKKTKTNHPIRGEKHHPCSTNRQTFVMASRKNAPSAFENGV